MAGELYAASRHVRAIALTHGTPAMHTIALHAVDLALEVHDRKRMHERYQALGVGSLWINVDETDPGQRWAVRLAQARRDADGKRQQQLLRRGSVVDVLGWAATAILAAHSGPLSTLVAALMGEHGMKGQVEWVSPPTRPQARRLVARPSDLAAEPVDGWLGLGL